jgi:hypothetical protein
MTQSTFDVDRWSGILAHLEASSSPQQSLLSSREKGASEEPPAYPSRNRLPLGRAGDQLYSSLTVRILEARSESTITISWHDPTACHYGDQTWRRGRAKHAGRCAISGAVIAAGADVFLPPTRRPYAANAGTMILAVSVPIPNALRKEL